MTAGNREGFETPSGKGTADENFPVGSYLIAGALRPDVSAYYAFARAIDDIADNSELSSREKIERLDAFEQALLSGSEDPALSKAEIVRQRFEARKLTIRHCTDLISAFKQDAVKLRYNTWGELIGYCNRSAAPVGRFLLDLHGENKSAWPLSDALCNALQVINHLQDCQDDYRSLDRVYLPLEWLDHAGETVEALDRNAASPALRTVIDKCLAGTRGLLIEARKLSGQLKSRRLSAESAAIVRIADRLTERLTYQDPLATRVKLSKLEFGFAMLGGAIDAIIGRRRTG